MKSRVAVVVLGRFSRACITRAFYPPIKISYQSRGGSRGSAVRARRSARANEYFAPRIRRPVSCFTQRRCWGGNTNLCVAAHTGACRLSILLFGRTTNETPGEQAGRCARSHRFPRCEMFNLISGRRSASGFSRRACALADADREERYISAGDLRAASGVSGKRMSAERKTRDTRKRVKSAVGRRPHKFPDTMETQRVKRDIESARGRIPIDPSADNPRSPERLR